MSCCFEEFSSDHIWFWWPNKKYVYVMLTIFIKVLQLKSVIWILQPIEHLSDYRFRKLYGYLLHIVRLYMQKIRVHYAKNKKSFLLMENVGLNINGSWFLRIQHFYEKFSFIFIKIMKITRRWNTLIRLWYCESIYLMTSINYHK